MILSLLDRLQQKGQEDDGYKDSLNEPDWVALSQQASAQKCCANDWKRAFTVSRSKTRQHKTSGRNDEKRHTDVIFAVMDALVNVLVDEVLILHCHENDDCQEPDDRHSERSRVGSELLQAADVFQSEHSRVSSELIVARVRRKKMRSLVGATTKMFASRHNSVHHRPS